ncbi:MAG TPA: beta-ketoacyl synthase N-terminal-like domain-containing protein, partial [Candidatus Nanopelagicales bacterium]|nr:beta-ketoacyl synthase N-terminal-like domain-containing protein [Candidatus Nanopelagicales bacterium]
ARRLGRLGTRPLSTENGLRALTFAIGGARAGSWVVLEGDPAAARALLTLRPEGSVKAEAIPARIEPTTPSAPEGEMPIAVIGVAGRYPHAADLEQFWENLRRGHDAITDIPPDRWDHDRWYDPERTRKDRAHTRWGGFIEEIDRFDPLFFNIAPREAEIMDPQERLFLEASWHTLEDAGYSRKDLDGERVGVFVGVMYSHYQLLGLESALLGRGPSPGNFFASIANRVSFFFNFRGPSLALDTMCSSSLTALHLACESLRRKESSYALVGGVNLMLHPTKYVFLSQARMASSDGRCRGFGAGGDGYVPGEGVGAVLLKPLRQAEADGDRILAVIRGSAVNHGGRTSGYSVPSPRAQGDVILEAVKRAGVDPRTIGYVEAHGTGTALGDPIEIDALSRVFRQWTAERGFSAIGTVKSNIGHLESAAGIAGLTKLLLQLRHRTLAPTLHAETLNPAIDFERSPFVVQREAAPWRPRTDEAGAPLPLRAALSSFGAGGANAHVIIEEPPASAPRQVSRPGPYLFVFSAARPDRLRALITRHVDFLSRDPELDPADVAHTLQVGREALACRLAVVASDLQTLVDALSRWLSGDTTAPGIHEGRRIDGPPLFRDDDEDVSDLFSRWAARGKLDRIAELWVAGAAIDWRLLARGDRPRRLALPGYPFARERYWLPELPSAPMLTAADASPCLGMLDPRGAFEGVLRFRKLWSSREPYLDQHRIFGRPVLPGAVYLEAAFEAARQLDPKSAFHLRDVRWLAP